MANISVLNYCVDSWHYQQEGNRILKFISAVQRGIPLRSFATLKCKRAKNGEEITEIDCSRSSNKERNSCHCRRFKFAMLFSLRIYFCCVCQKMRNIIHCTADSYRRSTLDTAEKRQHCVGLWQSVGLLVSIPSEIWKLMLDGWCRCRNYAIFIIWKSYKRWTIKFFLAAKNPPRRHSSAQWELWSQHTGPMLETFFSLPNDIERKIFQEALGI